MNSLSEFLSLPLLDFIPSNSPSNNTEQPNEIEILLETLSESDIQLLDRRLATTSAMINTSKTSWAVLLPMLSISRAIAHAPEILLTIPL